MAVPLSAHPSPSPSLNSAGSIADSSEVGSGSYAPVHPVSGHNYLPSNPSSGHRADIPRAVTSVEPHGGSLLDQQKALDAQLEKVLNLQWASHEMDKFIRCLDDEGFAKKAGIQISICTEGTHGQFVCIAPPDKGISAENLKKFKNMVKAVLEKQKSENDKVPVDFDHQIQSIGQQMQALAKKGGFQHFDFNSGLQRARAKARTFAWSDAQHKVSVTMYQAEQTGKPGDSQQLQENHEKKLREQQAIKEQEEMKLRELQLLQAEQLRRQQAIHQNAVR